MGRAKWNKRINSNYKKNAEIMSAFMQIAGPNIVQEFKAPNADRLAFTIKGSNGAELIAHWNENEAIGSGINTPTHYFQKMKDPAGDYNFEMTLADKDSVYVTVEGTPWNHFKMDKKRAYWEWDMIWSVIGDPLILK